MTQWVSSQVGVLRSDLRHIADWVPQGARVLDLGCGAGHLLQYLQIHKKVHGVGVEIDPAYIQQCIKNGVNVVQQNLEQGLAFFNNKQFDVVILSQTLQAMHHTEHILKEMARVARFGVVSFPNFGYWRHGWSILLGRMPVTGQMPYAWYNTPNVHLCTLKDFEDLATQLQLYIVQRQTFTRGKPVHFLPDWRSALALYYFQSP